MQKVCSEMYLPHLHVLIISVLVVFSLATLVCPLSKSILVQPKLNTKTEQVGCLIYFIWCNQCVRYLMEMEGYCTEIPG